MPNTLLSKKAYEYEGLSSSLSQLDVKSFVFPENWLDEVGANCYPNNKEKAVEITKCLKSFTGIIPAGPDKITLCKKEQEALTKKLKIFYLLLLGKVKQKISDSQKEIIRGKIQDGAQPNLCPQGMMIKAQTILAAFNKITSLKQILTIYRNDIVEIAARQLCQTSFISPGMHEHAPNDFLNHAKKLGYGVEPKYSRDNFQIALSDHIKTQKIKNLMDETYTLSNITDTIVATLKQEMTDSMAYVGRLDAGYDMALDYFNIVPNFIGGILNLKVDNDLKLKIMDMGDEDSEDFGLFIYDINWDEVKRLVVKSLYQEDYFNINKNNDNYESEILEKIDSAIMKQKKLKQEKFFSQEMHTYSIFKIQY